MAVPNINDITAAIAAYIESIATSLPTVIAKVIDAPFAIHDLEKEGTEPVIYVSSGGGAVQQADDVRGDGADGNEYTYTVNVEVIDFTQTGSANVVELSLLTQALRAALTNMSMAGAEFWGYAIEGPVPEFGVEQLESGLYFRSVIPIQYITYD